jgi:hypothetical protein
VQQDNASTQLDQPEQAQRLAGRFPKLGWVRPLNRRARLVNPLRTEPWLRGRDYYGARDQAAYSTDVLFADRPAPAGLDPRWLDHAALPFAAQDILTFRGRRLHPRCDGEVLTDGKKGR